MLLDLCIENAFSFKEEVCFSMIATKERQHSERLNSTPDKIKRVLPISLIYGANGAGKTNLIKALACIQALVTKIPDLNTETGFVPFKLNKDSFQKPSKFKIKFLAGDTVYEFECELDSQKIYKEALFKHVKKKVFRLYYREGENFTLDDPEQYSENDVQRAKFAFENTRDNQLYLQSSVYNNLPFFREAFNWFSITLVLVSPFTRYVPELRTIDGQDLSEYLERLIKEINVGIDSLIKEEVDIKQNKDLEDVANKLSNNTGKQCNGKKNKDYFWVTRLADEVKAYKIYCGHKTDDGSVIKMTPLEESDGTCRLLDLAPMLSEMLFLRSNRVFIVDELDRGLHPKLTYDLIKAFLDGRSSTNRTQLISTCHDVNLLDQDLMRKDEIWFMEKANGSSSIYRMSDLDVKGKKARFDLNLRKAYMEGLLPGVPKTKISVEKLI